MLKKKLKIDFYSWPQFPPPASPLPTPQTTPCNFLKSLLVHAFPAAASCAQSEIPASLWTWPPATSVSASMSFHLFPEKPILLHASRSGFGDPSCALMELNCIELEVLFLLAVFATKVWDIWKQDPVALICVSHLSYGGIWSSEASSIC